MIGVALLTSSKKPVLTRGINGNVMLVLFRTVRVVGFLVRHSLAVLVTSSVGGLFSISAPFV